MQRLHFLVFAAVLLTGCVRPDATSLTVVSPAGGARQVSILVASNRVPSDDAAGSFTAGRSDKLRYFEVTVSIPPGHKPPSIEWPKGRPDPGKSFAVVNRKILTKAEFVALARDGQRQTGGVSRAGMFVHGFNYSYQEALFRLAQMSADAGVGGNPILFDWPSLGSVRGYLADKDAVAFARDDMVTVLTDLGRANVKTSILAHSMGAWLAMETVRQLSLMGRTDALRAVDQVVLAAPDIDIDLFRKQLAVTRRLDKPIVILASKDDRALALSRRLARSSATAGSLDIDDPRTKELARQENLDIIDISDLPSLNGSNHDRFAALAAAYPQLRNNTHQNPIAGTGALVLNGVGSAVTAPLRLGRSLLAE